MTDRKITTTKNSIHGAKIMRTISSAPIDANLAFFKVLYKIDFPEGVPENLRTHYPEQVQCGFARAEDIAAFANDTAPALTSIPLLRLAPAGFREAAKTHGFPRALQQFEKQFVWNGDFLEQFAQGVADIDDIVYLDHGSHMLFDRNHDVLPTALSFDHLNRMVHNGAYYLDRALEVLAKDARVIPRASKDALRRNPELADVLAITNVDYCDSSYTQSIEFAFSPTPDDMRTIWAKAQSYGTQYPSTMLRQAVFDLDMLGLRAAGAAKYDKFYGCDEPTENNDD